MLCCCVSSSQVSSESGDPTYASIPLASPRALLAASCAASVLRFGLLRLPSDLSILLALRHPEQQFS